VLLGPPDQVRELARSLGLHLPDGVTVVDPQAVAERYVAPLAALRKHRGWTEEMARDHLADPITVGTMMLQQGEVDGLVAGTVHITAATVRPALQILGTRPTLLSRVRRRRGPLASNPGCSGGERRPGAAGSGQARERSQPRCLGRRHRL
jgi:phosphotransacetylase